MVSDTQLSARKLGKENVCGDIQGSRANCMVGKCLEEIVYRKNVPGMTMEKCPECHAALQTPYVAVMNIDSNLNCLHLLHHIGQFIAITALSLNEHSLSDHRVMLLNSHSKDHFKTLLRKIVRKT